MASLGTRVTGPDDHSNTRTNPDNSSSLGANAYKRLRPKVEKVTLAQELIEARDVPKMLRQTAKMYHDLAKHAKRVRGSDLDVLAGHGYGMRRHQRLNTAQVGRDGAGHFLNYQFGWVPFVKGVGDMLDLVDNYYTYVERAKRKNGEWVRRRITEDDVASDTVVSDVTRDRSSPSFVEYYSPSYPGVQRARMQVRRQYVVRIWYEGKFRVYRPEFDQDAEMHPQVRSARQFLTLAGLNPDPVTLYKVTPWSWLIDWFSNTGALLQRFQDEISGTIVSKYMYVMREIFDRYAYTATQWRSNGPVQDGTTYRELRTKARFPATSNFDFSLPTGGLTDRQSAILIALGLARV
jgi:hypothetical protein